MFAVIRNKLLTKLVIMFPNEISEFATMFDDIFVALEINTPVLNPHAFEFLEIVTSDVSLIHVYISNGDTRPCVT